MSIGKTIHRVEIHNYIRSWGNGLKSRHPLRQSGSQTYTPCEVSNLTNQFNRKWGVFDPKFEGSHSISYYHHMNEFQTNEAMKSYASNHTNMLYYQNNNLLFLNSREKTYFKPKWWNLPRRYYQCTITPLSPSDSTPRTGPCFSWWRPAAWMPCH